MNLWLKEKGKMIKELNSNLSIVKMQLAREDISPAQARQLLAFATTQIPGEVRVKYFRDQHISTVRADVHVDAKGEALVNFHGVVHVEITYKGDMVRSSKRTREKIDHRLHELAQEYCAQSVHKEILDSLETAEK